MSEGMPLQVQFQLRRPAIAERAAPRSPRGRLPQITRILALAIYFDEMIRQGDACDYAGVGRLSCLCRERVSQVMRLLYLAPDIQVELLYLPPVSAGRFPISETALRKIANLLSWADQRREWARLKQLRLIRREQA
jgi:hypothetical protein